MANALAPAQASSPSKPAAAGNVKKVQEIAASLERRLESARGSLARVKENSGNAMEGLVMTLEMQGANTVGAMAEGYFGEAKMDLGSMDMRTLLGVGLGAKGLMDIMNGESGAHELALGNGFLASGLGRMARNAGQKLRESYDKDKGSSEAAAPAGAAAPAPSIDVKAPGEGWQDYNRVSREIVVAADEDEPPRRRRERGGSRRRERGSERGSERAANNPWTQVSLAG